MSFSIPHEVVQPGEAFPADPYVPTFANGRCTPCRLLGPASLVRLVDSSRYFSASPPGDFWMEESLFRMFIANAHSDLLSQNKGLPPHLVGLHARFQLRDALAVSRDWSNLDCFISLTLPPGASVIALVGEARGQSYYSAEFHDQAARAKAEEIGVTLPGGRVQVVIDFQFHANQTARNWVRGPFPF